MQKWHLMLVVMSDWFHLFQSFVVMISTNVYGWILSSLLVLLVIIVEGKILRLFIDHNCSITVDACLCIEHLDITQWS